MNKKPDPLLVEYLKNATSILIFTGARISTGSGIPDYRGPQGVWKTRTPIYYQEFMNSEHSRIEYWKYKSEAWEICKRARPNATHFSIVQLEKADKLLMLVTQNIDALHQRAGTSQSRLVELHGTMASVECQQCHTMSDPEPHFRRFKESQKAPVCGCGGYLKPATISFGQQLREDDLRKAFAATAEADLVIALGSTLSVTPAAMIPLQAALRGTPYIIINRGQTDHDDHSTVSLRLEGDVNEVFPPAVEASLA